MLYTSVRGADGLQLGLSEDLGARLSLFRRRHRGRVGEEPLLFGPAEHGAHPSMITSLRRVGELILVDERADVRRSEARGLQVGPGFARKVFEYGPVAFICLFGPSAGHAGPSHASLFLGVELGKLLQGRVVLRLGRGAGLRLRPRVIFAPIVELLAVLGLFFGLSLGVGVFRKRVGGLLRGAMRVVVAELPFGLEGAERGHCSFVLRNEMCTQQGGEA